MRSRIGRSFGNTNVPMRYPSLCLINFFRGEIGETGREREFYGVKFILSPIENDNHEFQFLFKFSIL